MPSYRPVCFTNNPNAKILNWRAKKPWHARQKRGVTEWSLGYYATREEALQAEQEFIEYYPKAKNGKGVHQRAS